MKHRIILLFAAMLLCTAPVCAQTALKRIYNENIDPMAQIDSAVVAAQQSGRFVICQVGGNWCKWCLRFADFIEKDSLIRETIRQNYVYIHVNYPTRGSEVNAQRQALIQRLHNCGRFGYPCLVVLDEKGNVLHIQDSSFLEEGEGYNHDAVLRFLNGWTPKAVKHEEVTNNGK